MTNQGPTQDERWQVFSALHQTFDWIVCALGVLLILAGLLQWALQ